MMNKLIIIGNGFDLAHKMKTSYYDFVFNYIKNAFLVAEEKSQYYDELMSIEKNPYGRYKMQVAGANKVSDFKECLVSKMNAGFILGAADYGSARENQEPYIWKIKSKFIEHLFIVCCDYNWVDIENEYYSELKSLLKKDDAAKTKELKELNQSFKVLINELEKYLTAQKPTHLHSEFLEIFNEFIHNKEVVELEVKEYEPPIKSLILNFNYTTTIEEYKQDHQRVGAYLKIPINYIHGQVGNVKNPIIFGFGDEYDEDYSTIESEKNNEFLNYFKSFWYPKTTNYHDLIRFIEDDSFQVSIAGHSCGLSDRTMLKMIFEHQNCKSIKIYYYQNGESNNYTTLTQEISRHFSDKGVMRKKIVPFPYCKPMPQVEIT